MNNNECYGVLRSSLQQLLKINSTNEIYDIIGLGLNKCVQHSIVIVNEVTEHETMTITRGIYGIEKSRLAHYFDMLGTNPIGQSYKLTNSLRELYQKGGLHTINKGLSVFSNSFFEEKLLLAITKLLDIRQIYTIGLKKDDKIIAAIHIFKQHEKVIEEKEMVTQIIGQAEIALQNRLYQMELEQALLSKKRFQSILAHDLKNPFTSIIGILQIIERGISKYSTEKLQHLVQQVLGEAQNTYELLDNLLTWSNAEHDNITFTEDRVDLYNTSLDIINQFKLTAEKKMISIDTQIPPDTFVISDYQMLHTIIRNLISNAIKFTPAQGEIKIHTEIISKAHINFCVSDSGAGIDEETQVKILHSEPFFSTPGTQNEKGNGLGLQIVRDFIGRHNSTLKIKSTPGTGTKFYFSLHIATN